MSKEYYRSNDLIISDSVIQVGNGSVYQLKNVNSHKILQYPYQPERFTVENLKRTLFIISPIVVATIPVVGGLLFIPVAGFCWWKAYKIWKNIPKNYYSVVLSTSSGDVQSFSSLNIEEIQEIADAITAAMSSKAA